MLAFHYRPCTTPYTPPTWADGTDAEIAEAVAKADAGEIDLTEYWAVGDERTVSLAEIYANGSGSFQNSMPEQNIVMILMNEGYMNQEGIHFVVGQKDCLSNYGRINTSNTNVGSWNSAFIRLDLNKNVNGGYYYAIPDNLKFIFKEFTVTTAASVSNSLNQTGTYKFALFAEKEVFGLQQNSLPTEASVLSQIKYYETSSNRIKFCAANNGNYHWHLRSPYINNAKGFCCSTIEGGCRFGNGDSYFGVAPFGCI